MGYHISITRERQGSESDIPLEEWIAYVHGSSDFQFEMPTGTDQATEFTRTIHAARWSGGEGTWLGWSHGEIWTKNPPEELIRHMIAIASNFNARVRGDEGEFYRSIEDIYYEENGREIPLQEYEQKRMADVARDKKKRFYANCIRMAIMVIALYATIRKCLLLIN